MKRITAFLIGAAATLSAMADVTVANDSTLYYLDTKEYGNDIITVNVKKSITLPSGLSDNQTALLLNAVNSDCPVEKRDGILVYKEPQAYDINQAKPITEKVRAKITSQNKKGRPATANWEVIETVNTLPTVDNIVVICDDVYSYCGGAHGMGVNRFINYSLTANKILSLSDFIDVNKPDVEKALRQAITKAFTAKYSGEWGDLRDFRQEDLLPVSKNFYLTPDGIAFSYQEYSVGPYAMGRPFVVLPYPTLMLINSAHLTK